MTRDRVRTWALGTWSVLALLYLFIPVFVVVLFSFNDNKGRFNFTWQGFTLRHWKDPFADPDLAAALKNSLLIAGLDTIIATALGTFMALALVRYSFRGRSSVDMFVFLPLSTPGGRARRRAAGAVPDARGEHGLRDHPDRARDVHDLLRGGDREGATWRAWTATSRRRRWTSAPPSGRRSAR